MSNIQDQLKRDMAESSEKAEQVRTELVHNITNLTQEIAQLKVITEHSSLLTLLLSFY